jgi:hypothetical protein
MLRGPIDLARLIHVEAHGNKQNTGDAALKTCQLNFH